MAKNSKTKTKASKTKKSEGEETKAKASRRPTKKELAQLDPTGIPSFAWYKPRAGTGIKGRATRPAREDVNTVPTPAASSKTSTMPTDDVKIVASTGPEPIHPTKTTTTPVVLTPASLTDEDAAALIMHFAHHAQHRIALKSVTPLSSSTPTLSAQAEAGPSNALESPRKTMVKRKRSEAEVGRDDAAKRPRTSKARAAKPVSKAAQENEGGKEKKGSKTRAKDKGKGKESEVDSAEGASVPPRVPYRIAEPGSKVKEGCIRLPPLARFTKATRR
ncbi:hypothetical protein PENSPDRAFT_749498 [Peniophora sp. CONT]|nr:hypothetical protein PENSPDRAFT_749498 [Peniophora sp. CONT]